MLRLLHTLLCAWEALSFVSSVLRGVFFCVQRAFMTRNSSRHFLHNATRFALCGVILLPLVSCQGNAQLPCKAQTFRHHKSFDVWDAKFIFVQNSKITAKIHRRTLCIRTLFCFWNWHFRSFAMELVCCLAPWCFGAWFSGSVFCATYLFTSSSDSQMKKPLVSSSMTDSVPGFSTTWL